MELEERPLFGGAMRCLVPCLYIDASEVRQVPDNQEVFLDGGPSDMSLVIELTQPIDLSDNLTRPPIDTSRTSITPAMQTSRAVAHFAALAADNTAASAEILRFAQVDCASVQSMGSTDGTLSWEVLLGVQTVAKFGKARDSVRVRIALGCLHLPLPHDVDILVTLNRPPCESGPTDDDLQTAIERVTASLKLDDPALFG